MLKTLHKFANPNHNVEIIESESDLEDALLERSKSYHFPQGVLREPALGLLR